MAAGDKAPEGPQRTSFRIMGSVGEPINPDAWERDFNKIGKGKCPFMQTMWQTERGA